MDIQCLIDAVDGNEQIVNLFRFISVSEGIELEDPESFDLLFGTDIEARSRVSSIDIQQMIAIAKAACKVIDFLSTKVCPIVAKM